MFLFDVVKRYALQQCGVSATVVEAFEINDMANDVYEYNFGHRPNQVTTVIMFFNFLMQNWLLASLSRITLVSIILKGDT